MAEDSEKAEISEKANIGAEDKDPLTKADFEALAQFRYAIRQFLSFSEGTSREAGISPQQYQALLAIKGYPGREEVTIGELAERLQLKHHSVVELIDRMAALDLITRKPAREDRRQVFVALTARAEACVAQVASQNREKLRELQLQIFDFRAGLKDGQESG